MLWLQRLRGHPWPWQERSWWSAGSGSCCRGLQRTCGRRGGGGGGEGGWDDPSEKKADCGGVKGDGYLRGKTGLGFLSRETKQMEINAADSTSAILISSYLIFQILSMLWEALVSCSNPFVFLLSISHTISIVSFSCEKAGNWKFPGAFKGWAQLRSSHNQPHLDMSSLDPE